MAHTPKSVRRHDKAAEASNRATEESYAHLYEDNHPAHRRQVRALDREDRTRAYTDRDWRRGVRRDMRQEDR